MAGDPLDRRNFFRHGLRQLTRTVADSVEGVLAGADEGRAPRTPVEARPHRRIRPPGALPEADFLAACTRCDACFDVCPVDAIVPVPAGRIDAGTPQLRPNQAACAVCTGLQCTHVCEPGALLPLQRPAQIDLGRAIVRPQHCVTWHGQHCDACTTICPTEPVPAVTLVDGHPSVLPQECIGCGLCEQVCPTEPKAIQVENPVREAHVRELEMDARRGDAGAMSREPSPSAPRRGDRRVRPIAEAQDEARLPPSTVPRPLAAALLIGAPVVAVVGLFGWLRILMAAPVGSPPAFSAAALVGDFFLCLAFVVPHSLLARGFGRRWLNLPLGPCGERPLYVLTTGVSLLVLAGLWTPSGPVLWAADGLLGALLRCVQAAGLVLAAWAALVVGGAGMLGLPHLRALAGGRREPSTELVALPPYSVIRQPLNLGLLIALATMPEVTLDRLLFGLVFAAWILLAAPVEERDAEMQFGEGYRSYRDRTPRWLPRRRANP